MDLWVVAAVAVAGYVAKFWQQISSREDGDSSEQPVSGALVYRQSDSGKLFHQFRNSALSLPRLVKKQSGKDCVFDEHFPEIYRFGGVLSLMNLSTCVNGIENSREIGYGEKGLIELPMRSKLGSAKHRLSISTTNASDQGTTHHSQGSSNQLLLFLLGIAIGIMSNANQREKGRLNQQLKQSEVLVRDLQKEPDKSTDYDDKEIGKNGAEKVEFMNKIEAELEAELEKLELGMNTARLQRISKLAELDHVSVEDVVHPANCAVSPMELSLRLHEVIKSRLEERIMELEAVLERHSINADHRISSGMLYSESEPSSTRGSSVCSYEGSDSDHEISLELIHENGHFQKVQIPEVEERWSRSDIMLDKFRIAEKEISRSCRSDAYGEEDHDDDEIERILKQIVERTKHDSPVIFNVQKRLCSMDL